MNIVELVSTYDPEILTTFYGYTDMDYNFHKIRHEIAFEYGDEKVKKYLRNRMFGTLDESEKQSLIKDYTLFHEYLLSSEIEEYKLMLRPVSTALDMLK